MQAPRRYVRLWYGNRLLWGGACALRLVFHGSCSVQPLCGVAIFALAQLMNVTFIRPKKRIKKATTDCLLKLADRARVHRSGHIPCVRGYQHGETHEWRRSSKVPAIITSLVLTLSVCVGTFDWFVVFSLPRSCSWVKRCCVESRSMELTWMTGSQGGLHGFRQ